MTDRELLVQLFDAAVAAADPVGALKPNLPEKPLGKTVVVGAGKGAAQLARAFETLWDGPLSGVVVTRYGYAEACSSINVMEASHPVPDAAGLKASRALIDAVTGLSEDDLVVALICGGGSSLLPAPTAGLTLEDEQELNRVLLASGAPISVMNAIRKQVSDIKGGRLAKAAWPAKVVSLVVSDVPGDDPAQVASGPTVPDNISPADALAMAAAYRINLPDRIRQHIENALQAPTPADLEFQRNDVSIVASAAISLDAAAKTASELGLDSVVLSDSIEGEAREIARMHGAMARETSRRNRPFRKPVVMLSGGETTVTLRGNGRGGRNTEFLLSLAIDIDGEAQVSALAADTDGIDGSEDNAGAFVDGGSCARLRMAGRDPAADLANNDAFSAFEAVGDLFSPGPTGTNVNDFRAILVR
ncbi:MAG: DUF4147 domain-containing protein [Rhodobacteraceae bacterium]|nr:DUF4147 domain-containing protein [Paracoccaceae bacterium]